MRDALRRLGDRRVNKLGFALAVAAVMSLLAGALSLAGCGAVQAEPETPAASTEEPNARVFHIQVDGRTVPCIMVDPPKDAIAVTCDWGAK